MQVNRLYKNNRVVNNHFILKSDNMVQLQSYDSIVVSIKNNVVYLHKNYNYSNTTLKYLYLFLENEVNCSKLNKSKLEKSINEGFIGDSFSFEGLYKIKLENNPL